MKRKITRHREDSAHNSCGVGLVLIECLKSWEVESSLLNGDRGQNGRYVVRINLLPAPHKFTDDYL